MNLPLWLASPGFVILFRWTCLLAFGWAVHWALRRRHARWRVILWRGVFCSGLFLPLLHFFPVPGVKIPVRMDAAAPVVFAGPPATEPATDDGASLIQPVQSAAVAQPTQSPLAATPAPAPALRSVKTFAPRASAKPVAWGHILAAIWLSGCVFGVIRLVRLQLQLSHLVKSSQPASDLRELARQIQGRLDVRREIDVRTSEAVSSPFVCGLWRPVIILPKTLAQSLLPDELSALLSHEIAHLRQHDLFWCIGWQWMKAVSWFHPLVWKIPAAHNLACEQEADRIAAGQLENEDFYPQMLARLALRVMAWPAAENKLTLNGSSQIARRLNYLGQEGIGAWNWKFSAAGLGIVALIFLITSGSGFSILPAPASQAGEGRAPLLVDQRHGSNMASTNRVAAHTQDAFSVSTEDLISKLQDESAQGIGVCVNIEFIGFIAIEDPIIYDAWGSSLFRNPGFIKPVTSPVMRELVRRGVAALPMLIDHLSDARPTKLTLSYPFIACFRYDPRDTEKPPAGGKKAETLVKRSIRSDYTLKVGDFCLVAVGQIVNRHLNAIQPGLDGLVGINSPVETPALAAAVKADWGGVMPADHERSLEKDALDPLVVGVWLDAIKRLMFYYPEPGAALALRFLNGPLYDNYLVMDFLENRLLKEKDESKQDRLLAEFRKENGEANCVAMESSLIEFEVMPYEDLVDPRKVLARAFPGVEYKHPPKSDGMDFRSMSRLVDSLAIYPSKAIDAAVYDLLKRTSEMHSTILQSVTERCELVHACARRLTKPGERDAFEKSYAAIMSSLPKKRQSGMEPQAGKMTAFSKRFQALLDDEIGKLAPQTL
jgi:beta-lactamase regulating signal transducer with metallopeptidase domain